MNHRINIPKNTTKILRKGNSKKEGKRERVRGRERERERERERKRERDQASDLSRYAPQAHLLFSKYEQNEPFQMYPSKKYFPNPVSCQSSLMMN